MPADLNKSLEECEAQARALVNEMQQYKSSRILNQKAADSLESVVDGMARVIKEIKPLTGVRMRRWIIIQSVAWSLTTALVIGLLVMVILGKLQ